MKKYMLIFMLLIPLKSYSISADFELNRVPLPDAINIIYRDLFKEPYMLSTDLIDDKRLVTFSLTRNIKSRPFIKRYLNNMNVKIWTKDGVDYIAPYKTPEKEKITYIYKPKHRSVIYLTNILSAQVQGEFNVNSSASTEKINVDQISSLVKNSTFSKSGDIIVFRGTKENVNIVKSILPKIDNVVDEILVSGYVVEVSSTVEEGNGLSMVANLFKSSLGIQFNSGLTPKSGNILTFSNGTFTALAELFNKDSRFKIVSSPQIRVKNESKATFSVGSDVPVVSSTTYDNGKPIQSIEYKTSGVLFNIFPSIKSETIDLVIQQQISNFVKTDTGVNFSPTLIKRDVSTEVSVKDGEIIVLGGLAETKNSDNATSFSFIPFLKSTGKEDTKTDIVVVLEAKKIAK